MRIKIDGFLVMYAVVIVLGAIAIILTCNRHKDLSGERKYIGKLRKLEVKPGGFMSSDYTIFYCDSAVISVKGIESNVLQRDCWEMDGGKSFYIDGRKNKLDIQ